MIFCNPKCCAKPSNLAPSYDVFSWLYQFDNLALKSPRKTVITELLLATWSRVSSKSSKNFISKK